MNFQEYLYNQGFQREDLLARMAESLELDDSRSNRMESAYNAIYDVLKADAVFFSKVDFVVYPQGSKAIGTTTKPFGKDEFDWEVGRCGKGQEAFVGSGGPNIRFSIGGITFGGQG